MADAMAEWQKEWQNGRMAEMDTYVLFMVHADTDTNDTDDTLIFYSTSRSGLRRAGGPARRTGGVLVFFLFVVCGA